MCSQVSPALCLSVFLLFSTYCDSKTIRDNEIDSSDHGCKINNRKYKVGEKFPGEIGDCSIYTCQKNGYSALTCPAFMVLPESGCYITETDLTVQYPACCPRAVCPEERPTPPTITLNHTAV